MWLPGECHCIVIIVSAPEFSGEVIGIENPVVSFGVSVRAAAFHAALYIAHGEIFCGFTKEPGVIGYAHLVHVDLEEVIKQHETTFIGNSGFEVGVGVVDGVLAMVAILFVLHHLGDVAIGVGDLEVVATFGAF